MGIVVTPGSDPSLEIAFWRIESTGQVVIEQPFEKTLISLSIFPSSDGLVGRTGIKSLENGFILLIPIIPIDRILLPKDIALVHALPNSLELLEIGFAFAVIGIHPLERFFSARGKQKNQQGKSQ